MRLVDIPLRQRPPVIWLTVLAAIAVLAFLFSLLFSWLIETRQTRTVVVSALSSRVALTIRDDQAPFMLGETLLCLPRVNPRRPRDYQPVMGCDPGAWFVLRGGDRLPPAAEVEGADWPDGTIWPEAFVLSPPPGTRIEFEIMGENAEIRFLDLPASGQQLPGIVSQARLIKPTAALEERGRYLVRADLELGSPPGISMQGYVKSGEIVFHAPALFASGWGAPATIRLREDQIPPGGFVRFVNLRDGETNAMNVQLIADADAQGFGVQAVNVPGPTAVDLQYVGTETLRLVPLWIDLVLKDPFIALLTAFTALTGLGALIKFRPRAQK